MRLWTDIESVVEDMVHAAVVAGGAPTKLKLGHEEMAALHDADGLGRVVLPSGVPLVVTSLMTSSGTLKIEAVDVPSICVVE